MGWSGRRWRRCTRGARAGWTAGRRTELRSAVERAERQEDEDDGADVEEEAHPRQYDGADDEARDGRGEKAQDPPPGRSGLAAVAVVGGFDEHERDHGRRWGELTPVPRGVPRVRSRRPICRLARPRSSYACP